MMTKQKNAIYLIHIDDYSKTPKYRQIINSIMTAIEHSDLQIDDKLPSVNQLLIEFDISRDTIVKAYDFLKKNGVIASIPGKGYYVQTDKIAKRPKVLLLFNKLSAHKKLIYDSFYKTLGEDAIIDFYIYNNDFTLFKRILSEKKDGGYTHYVIIPHFVEGGEGADALISQIPPNKLIVLDKVIDAPSLSIHSCIYQDFESDIYNALTQLNERLKRYKRLVLIFPHDSYHPHLIEKGFVKFCTEYAYQYTIKDHISDVSVAQGDVYITVVEDELVYLIKKIKEHQLKVGEDIGIISYNDTIIKEVLLDGITTVSTDFRHLGRRAAQCILDQSTLVEANPFSVQIRNSL